MPRRGWLLVLPLILLLLGVSRPTSVAAILRNLGNLSLVGELMEADGGCTQVSLEVAEGYLSQAMRIDPREPASWRTLLRLKGLADRHWIADLTRVREEWTEEESRAAMQSATQSLFPASGAMQTEWSTYRCLQAWGAWTLALLEARNGQLERAVALYQAGLGLAPGRVPPEIVSEYYLALARYVLTTGDVAPYRELAAAKYLALGGAMGEAEGLFEAWSQHAALTPQERCDALRWRAWLEEGGDEESTLPPGPATWSPVDGSCEGEAGAATASELGWSPEWVITEGEPVVDPARGGVLWGFDLDADLLEAGAEVLGTLYWRMPDGQVQAQGFRLPNLWPNSGNSWRYLPGFTSCVPGYQQPPLGPCTTDTLWLEGKDGKQGWVGRVRSSLAKGVEFVSTASVSLIAGELVVYGGGWRIHGDLPRAHVAQFGVVKDPTHAYQVVLSLHTLPSESWQRTVGAVSAPRTAEFTSWIRPRVAVGEGSILFDQVFSFVLLSQLIRIQDDSGG